jgi:16S rRNA (cytosine967-C5)-methyltransferase
LALLLRAAEVVRPGGRLVYATCSSEPEENDRVVANFAALRTDFRIVNLLTHRSTVIAPFVDAEGFFRTTPHRHGLEAFFAALLTRH